MFSQSKILAAALGAILLSAAEPAFAGPDYVAPKKASLRVKDIHCPGNATMKFVVWSKRPGSVKVELERRGYGILGSDVIKADIRKKGSYRGVFSGTVSLSDRNTSATYRIIASGNGRVKASKWVRVPCKLDM